MDQRFHPNINDYELIYGALPDDRGELVLKLQENLKLDPEKVIEEENRINSIEWLEKDLIFYLVPKGTPRPRNDGTHFYVKHADEAHRLFKKYLSGEGIICTRVSYELEAFLPTPLTNMTKMEVLMAEKGLIRPLVTPDWDNLAKTYTDCLQNVLLLNDNVICDGKVSKYYSVKPRIRIILRWMREFDSRFNEKKTIVTVGYKKLVNGGTTIL